MRPGSHTKVSLPLVLPQNRHPEAYPPLSHKDPGFADSKTPKLRLSFRTETPAMLRRPPAPDPPLTAHS